MRKHLLTLVLALGFISVYSQSIWLKEDKIISGDGSANGWQFQVCEDAEYAKSDMKSFLKDELNLKAKKKNKYTYIVPEAEIPNVSTKRGDLLIYLQHSDTGNIMALSFAMGYDIFLNSKDNATEMEHFKKIAKDYIEYHYNSYYSNKIEELDKELNSVKKDLHKKESSISSLRKKEKNVEKKLSKEEDSDKITELENESEELQTEIENTYDVLPALKEQIETLEEKRDSSKQELINCQNQIKNI